MTEMTVADLDFSYLISSRHFHLFALFPQTGPCGLNMSGRQPEFVFLLME